MTIKTINMSYHIGAVKEKHNAYLRSKALCDELATVWGYSPDSKAVNNCGVILNSERLILYQNGRSYIHMELVQTPIGLWIYSLNWSGVSCGMGYAPSIWTKYAYQKREDSRLAAIERLLKRFTADEQTESSQSEINEKMHMLKALKEAHVPQLALW